MQINTSAFLSMLGSRVDNNLKQKIQNASSEGKTNLVPLIKDKSVQSLLSDTFKYLIEGTKTKNAVFEMLQNSKSLFDVKNFSNDIKNIVSSLEKEPKLQKQGIVLKEFLANIKNIDQNNIRSALTNSGILLESKLKQISYLGSDPSVDSKLKIQNFLSELKLSLKSGTITKPPSIPAEVDKSDLSVKIKTAINDLLNNMKNISSAIKADNKIVDGFIKEIISIDKAISKEISLHHSDFLRSSLNSLQKDLTSVLQNDVNKSVLSNLNTNMAQVSSYAAKADIAIEVKNAVNSLLSEIKAVNFDNKQSVQNILNNFTLVQNKISDTASPLKTPQASLSQDDIFFDMKSLKSSLSLIKNNGIDSNSLSLLKNNTVKVSRDIVKSDLPVSIKTSVTNLLNEIKTLPLDQKSAVSNVINKVEPVLEKIQNSIQIPKNEPKTADIKTVLHNLQSDIKGIIEQGIDQNRINSINQNISDLQKTITKSDIAIETKNAIQNILNEIKSTPLDQKLHPSIPLLKNIVSNISKIELPNVQANQTLPNSIQNLNISNDLKGSLLQIIQSIDNGEVSAPNELKSNVEKILTQIEFFQTLSYTTSSNHMFLPISWDNIDDGDIKFHSDKQDNFSCQINLILKEYNELKVLLQLDTKNNININVGVEHPLLKEKIQQNLQELRAKINSINLNLQSLNIFDLYESKTPYDTNVKTSSQTLNFGVDLKA